MAMIYPDTSKSRVSAYLQLSRKELNVATYGIDKLGDYGWSKLVEKFHDLIDESIGRGGMDVTLDEIKSR